MKRGFVSILLAWSVLSPACRAAPLEEVSRPAPATESASAKVPGLVARPGLFSSITEPPCSYVSTQHRKGLVRDDDPVISWIRGAHNGGAAPLRYFLAGSRVVNDTYGLFFYDPDGGYVTVYAKDYGYEFHGWRRGVMVVRGKDGTLWSALSGRAIDGPQKGKRLTRVPSLPATWGYWRMLHPESTAYDLFDGKRYADHAIPAEATKESLESRGDVDPRLASDALVVGVEVGESARAFPIDSDPARERQCVTASVGETRVAVFWYGPTRSGTAFRAEVDGKPLSFRADSISPETAPFIDEETGSRWTIAGRAVDGPLRGKELEWVPGIPCRWFAWAAEFPETTIHEAR
jgi:hypothetical protein